MHNISKTDVGEIVKCNHWPMSKYSIGGSVHISAGSESFMAIAKAGSIFGDYTNMDMAQLVMESMQRNGFEPHCYCIKLGKSIASVGLMLVRPPLALILSYNSRHAYDDEKSYEVMRVAKEIGFEMLIKEMGVMFIGMYVKKNHGHPKKAAELLELDFFEDQKESPIGKELPLAENFSFIGGPIYTSTSVGLYARN